MTNREAGLSGAGLLKELRQKRAREILALAAFFGLLVLMVGLFCPIVTNDIRAKDGAGYNEEAWTKYPKGISVALDQELVIDLAPTAGGAISTATGRLVVASAGNAGYKIFVETKDANADMVNTNANDVGKIAGMTGASTLAQLAPNSWGYNIGTDEVDDATVFRGIDGSAAAVETTEESRYDEYNFTIGAKVDASLPAGQYANTLLISAVAKPETISGLTDLIYMQEMTSAVCANTKPTSGALTKDANGSYVIKPGQEITKQLIDLRDGKEYWVSKLADGECWMTQNLALNLTASEKITSNDTDLNSRAEWVVPEGGTTNGEIPPANTTAAPSTAYSWNLNQFALTTPLKGEDCGQITSVADLTNCAKVQNVTGWQPVWATQSATWQGETAQVAVNLDEKTYDAHYLLGNYYQFNAATAGSGGELINQNITAPEQLKDAPDSICPKGWQLPVSGQNNIDTMLPFSRAKSFFRMMLAYGYPATNDYISNGSAASAHWHDLGLQNPMATPIYLVRAGNMVLPDGKISGVGNSALYDSATADQWAISNYITFTTTVFFPSFGTHKHFGIPVRCVAR